MCKFKEKKYHLNKITKKGITSNKDFWNFVKPFSRNKDFIDGTDITLKLDNKIITDVTKLAEIFNNHYVNTVEQSTGLKLTALEQKGLSDKAELCSIIKSYKNHLSINQISKNLELLENEEKFCFKMVTTKYIKSLIQKVNAKKAAGIDSIPPKLVKLAAKPLFQPVPEATNMCIKRNNFSKVNKICQILDQPAS